MGGPGAGGLGDLSGLGGMGGGNDDDLGDEDDGLYRYQILMIREFNYLFILLLYITIIQMTFLTWRVIKWKNKANQRQKTRNPSEIFK